MSKIQGRQPAARMCFRNTGSWTGSWSRAKGQGVHAGLGAVCLVLGTLCPAVGQLHRAGQWEKSWRCSVAPLQPGLGFGVWGLGTVFRAELGQDAAHLGSSPKQLGNDPLLLCAPPRPPGLVNSVVFLFHGELFKLSFGDTAFPCKKQ